MADDTAFPKAPTDNICISISIGNTRAIANGVLQLSGIPDLGQLTVDCTMNFTPLGIDSCVSRSAGAVRRYWALIHSAPLRHMWRLAQVFLVYLAHIPWAKARYQSGPVPFIQANIPTDKNILKVQFFSRIASILATYLAMYRPLTNTAGWTDHGDRSCLTPPTHYGTIRTPRSKGKKDGTLHEVKPVDLGAGLLRALQARHDLDTSYVDDVVMGCHTCRRAGF